MFFTWKKSWFIGTVACVSTWFKEVDWFSYSESDLNKYRKTLKNLCGLNCRSVIEVLYPWLNDVSVRTPRFFSAPKAVLW